MKKLTPTEVAREMCMERRDVILKCMELSVVIHEGRIEIERFREALASTASKD